MQAMACLSIQPVQNSNLTFLYWREEQKHGRMRISSRRKAEKRIEPEHAPVGHAKEGMVNKTPQQLHKMLSTLQIDDVRNATNRTPDAKKPTQS